MNTDAELKDAIALIQRIAASKEAHLAELSEAEHEAIARAKAMVEAKIDHDASPLGRMFPDTGPFRRELYPRHVAFMNAGATARERLFIAGNRSGKTRCASTEISYHLLGQYPHWWQGRRWNEPIHCIAAGETKELMRDTICAEFFGAVDLKTGTNRLRLAGTNLIPPDAIIQESVEYGQGVRCPVEVRIRYKDSKTEYSQLSLRAYKQGREIFQGVARDIIWCDEEPPMDVYDEALVRLMTKKGMSLVTFTPLKGYSDLIRRFLSAAKGEHVDIDPYSEDAEERRYREFFADDVGVVAL